MDDDPVAGKIDWRKKREAHQVIPVQVRHEHVIGLRFPRSEAFEHRLSERAGAAAHVEDHVFVTAAVNLHTTGVAAKGSGDVETEAVDIGIDRRRAVQRMP